MTRSRQRVLIVVQVQMWQVLFCYRLYTAQTHYRSVLAAVTLSLTISSSKCSFLCPLALLLPASTILSNFVKFWSRLCLFHHRLLPATVLYTIFTFRTVHIKIYYLHNCNFAHHSSFILFLVHATECDQFPRPSWPASPLFHTIFHICPYPRSIAAIRQHPSPARASNFCGILAKVKNTKCNFKNCHLCTV